MLAEIKKKSCLGILLLLLKSEEDEKMKSKQSLGIMNDSILSGSFITVRGGRGRALHVKSSECSFTCFVVSKFSSDLFETHVWGFHEEKNFNVLPSQITTLRLPLVCS